VKRIAFVVLLVGAAHAIAFREVLAGSPAFFGWLLGAYLIASVVAIHHFWDEGTLLDKLGPRWGDLSIGALSAMTLLVASWLGRSVLAPSGTPRQAWLYRIYIQLGDPEVIQHSIWLTGALLALSIAEELVFRGLVLDLLSERLGSRVGWIAAALVYTVAISPTVYVLRDPVAGLNPLLVTAALGAGLVWSFLTARFGRLAPVAISHMAFIYFSVVQFRWPGS
jgi:membrane protease YdiL (CAAX protease family)